MSKRNGNHHASDNKKAKTVERPEDKDKFCTWYIIFPRILFAHHEQLIRTESNSLFYDPREEYIFSICNCNITISLFLTIIISSLVSNLFPHRTMGTKSKCPHILAPRKEVPKIMDTILGMTSAQYQESSCVFSL